jgi:predicted HicB family RNase H-like nuclease
MRGDVKLLVLLPEQLKADAKAAAAKNRETLSKFVEEAIRKHLKKIAK